MKRFNSQLRYVEARPRKDKKGAKATTSVVVAGAASSEGGVSKSYVDSNFVTLSTEQTIPGPKNFTGGIKVNGQPLIYNAELGVWELTGDLLVTGNVAWFASIKGFKPSTIMDAVQVDGETIVKNELGQLKAIGGGSGGSGGGLTVSDLSNYLTTNKYTKQSDVETLISTALTPYALTAAIPTNNSQLTNGAGYITSSALKGYATESWVTNKGYITASALTGYATEQWVKDRGYLTGITSAQVTTALGFTPYNATNPNNYISSITSKMVTDALGFTPYNSTNPDKYIKGINYDMVIAALGYTPYSTTNPMGYLTISSLNGYATEQWVGENYLASSNFTKSNLKSTLGISDWALAATKPSYTAAEVGAARSYGDVGANYSFGNWLGYSYNIAEHGAEMAGGVVSAGNDWYGFQLNGYYGGNALFFRGYDAQKFTAWKEILHSGNIGSYNAGSATKLQTARTIWGNSFDGTSDINGGIGFNSSQKISWFNDGANYYIAGAGVDGGAILEYKAYSGHRFLGGNVAIGRTTADAKLHVGGDAKFDGLLQVISNTSILKCNDSYGTWQTTNVLEHTWTSDESDGLKVSVPSYEANSVYLHLTRSKGAILNCGATINGNLWVNGNVSWVSQSQRSLKNIIDEQGLSLAQLERIKPIKFYWKDGRDSILHVGGVADVFAEVLPEVVSRWKDTLCLNYVDAGFYVGASLIAPVVDHERRIAQLEKENAELKQKLNQLAA